MEVFNDLMERAGFDTIDQLAADSGLSVRTIFNCRHKLTSPNRSTVKLLAQSLLVHPEEVTLALSERQ